MKYLVAIACMKANSLENPKEFFSNPSSRIQPRWLCQVFDGPENDSEAFEVGEKAFHARRFAGQEPDDELINWYVAPLD